MHDDQHGTAIISSAALLNALEITKKKIEKVKLVVNGAGAASISCAKLYVALGVKKENIIMLDSKGVISNKREGLTDENIEEIEEMKWNEIPDSLKIFAFDFCIVNGESFQE